MWVISWVLQTEPLEWDKWSSGAKERFDYLKMALAHEVTLWSGCYYLYYPKENGLASIGWYFYNTTILYNKLLG